jgi:hypothetical protein
MPNITINPENVKKDFIKIKSDSKKSNIYLSGRGIAKKQEII